jgi:cysteine desulfurase
MPAYLDHAATTPMRPEAVEAMLPFLTERFANPSGAHRLARDARRAIDEARDEMAALVGCDPGDVVFTSGGTEADNLAVFGAGRAVAAGADGELTARHGVAVCSAVEHHAVLDPVLALGGPTVAVDGTGRLDLDDLAAVLEREAARHHAGEGPGVRLVSVMVANNEVGTLQPLADVVALTRRLAPHAVVHTDAVQGFCTTDIAPLCADVDLLSLSAHKFGGPKGAGVLVVRPTARIAARQLGGGQERGRRSGTQDVAGIVAMATAARLTAAHRHDEAERLAKLRDRLVEGLSAIVPDVVETGTTTVDGLPDRTAKVPHVAHLCLRDVESEALLFLLERAEVYASAASSCASGAMEPSHVLTAMGVPPDLAGGSLRLSFGWASTDADVDHALAAIPPAVEQLRRFAL